MTTDIEKQFFDTFGIEPKLDCKRCGAKNFALGQCAEVSCKKTYPQITDRILLELIQVFAGAFGSFVIYRCKNFEHLKHIILSEMIAEHTCIKHRVQALFGEG